MRPLIQTTGLALRIETDLTGRGGAGDQIVISIPDIVLLPGQVGVLYGPSGSGKSTVIRSIRESLNDSISGLEVGAPPDRIRTVPQDFQGSLSGWLSLFRQLSDSRVGGRGPSIQPYDLYRLAATLGLHAAQLRATPRELSGGQMQRAAIARALAAGVPLVLMDEPTSSQDSQSREAIAGAIRSDADRNQTAFLIVTHDRDFGATVSDLSWELDVRSIHQDDSEL